MGSPQAEGGLQKGLRPGKGRLELSIWPEAPAL